MGELFGRRVRPSPLRDLLMRMVVDRFSDGRQVTMSDAVIECQAAGLGTANTVRRALKELHQAGLVVIRAAEHNARRTEIVPTAELVSFYRRNLNELLAEAIAMTMEILSRQALETRNN